MFFLAKDGKFKLVNMDNMALYLSVLLSCCNSVFRVFRHSLPFIPRGFLKFTVFACGVQHLRNVLI